MWKIQGRNGEADTDSLFQEAANDPFCRLSGQAGKITLGLQNPTCLLITSLGGTPDFDSCLPGLCWAYDMQQEKYHGQNPDQSMHTDRSGPTDGPDLLNIQQTEKTGPKDHPRYTAPPEMWPSPDTF